MTLDFYVERRYRRGKPLPWAADIFEEKPPLRKHDPPQRIYHSTVIAITRFGLYFNVRRRCHEIKRNRGLAAKPPKGQKTWKVRV